MIRRALGNGFQLRMKKEMRRLVTRHEERPEQSVAIFKMTKIDRLLRAVFAHAPKAPVPSECVVEAAWRGYDTDRLAATEGV